MNTAMSGFGVNPAQSIAGIGNAERLAARDVDKARSDERRVRGKRRDDEVQISGGAEAVEAVRSLKDPTQEEAKEDRNAKAKQSSPPPQGRRLDVKG